MTQLNGVPTDLSGGIAALAVHSLYVLRDGTPINLDSSAGVTFVSVSGAGQYLAILDHTALLIETGAAFVLQSGDVVNFSASAEIEPGQFIYGVQQQAIIEVDLLESFNTLSSQISGITPTVIEPDPAAVLSGVVFGQAGNEQVGTLEFPTTSSATAGAAGTASVDLKGTPLVELELEPLFTELQEGQAFCYLTRDDLDTMYGEQNIDEWADHNNCNTEESRKLIARSVLTAAEWAESYINDSLRHLYCGAVWFENCDEETPRTINHIATAIAGHELRDSRVVNEADPVLLRKYERAMDKLNQLKEGSIRVPGFTAKAHPQFR